MDALAVVPDEEELFQRFCELRREVVQRKREAYAPLALQDQRLQLMALTNGVREVMVQPVRKRSPSPEDELTKAVEETRREQARLMAASSAVVCAGEFKEEPPYRRRRRAEKLKKSESSAASSAPATRWKPRRHRDAEPVYICPLTAEEKQQAVVEETIKELCKLGEVLGDTANEAGPKAVASAADVADSAPPEPQSSAATGQRRKEAALAMPAVEDKSQEQASSDDELLMVFADARRLRGWSSDERRNKQQKLAT